MKILITFISFLLVISCKRSELKNSTNFCDSVEYRMTEREKKYDSLFQRAIDMRKTVDSIKLNINADLYLEKISDLERKNDSLKIINNKLGKELLHDKQVIENAKYYLNIVNKNPSQQKFLRGWMNRALNQ